MPITPSIFNLLNQIINYSASFSLKFCWWDFSATLSETQLQAGSYNSTESCF